MVIRTVLVLRELFEGLGPKHRVTDWPPDRNTLVPFFAEEGRIVR